MEIFFIAIGVLIAVMLAVALLAAFGLFGAVLALVGVLFGRIEARNELPRSRLTGCLVVGGTVTAVVAFALLGLLILAMELG